MIQASYNPTDVKLAAKGRWLDVLQSLGGLTAEQLNGKNQPCPKCGGKDRYAAFKDVAETGGTNCRSCGSHGDGFATLQWLTGNSFGQVLVSVANHIGAAPKNGFASRTTSNGKPHKSAEIIKAHDYKDESGRLLFQVVRCEGKQFKQRRPKDGGGWTWSLGDVRLVPYRLPQIIQADRDDWLYVCEGEKDCDAMAGIGLVATCNNGGAGKWGESHSLCLAGRQVCIVPDQDVAGRKHCRIVAESLLAQGCTVRVVNVPTGKDAADWIESGGDAPQLLAMVEAAHDIAPGELVDDVAVDTATTDDRPQVTTLAEEMSAALERECAGSSPLITTGLSELDGAIGGGLAFGEIVVVAARPSHGKSAIGLQFIHHWTQLGIACAFASEEMTNDMVGERALQFATELRKSDWVKAREDVAGDIGQYTRSRATAYVIRKTGDLPKLLGLMQGLVESSGVRCIIVDYAQQLAECGRRQYEAVTEVSKSLAAFARMTNVVLVALAQHSRAIEGRESFIPRNSDLKESGQLEQDADVILHLVWPWMLDNAKPKDDYQIYIGKNRNRAIGAKVVNLIFEPHRQRVVGPPIESHPAYNPSFADFNKRGQGDEF